MDYLGAKKFILEKLDAELSQDLFYHGVHHTLDVLNICTELSIKEKVGAYDTILLKTAALYHDSGFTETTKGHEAIGCAIARKNLPRFNYSEAEIERICGMIMATKIPQSPKNKLEEIICDADLDYLGRTDFYSIGNTLFEELKVLGVLSTVEAWNAIQVKFLTAHRYFTETNKKRRARQKLKYLEELKVVVAGYEK